MSNDTFSLLLSSLAVIISLASLIWTRGINKKQIELQKITAELSQRQMEIIDFEESEKKKEKIAISFDKENNNYFFAIKNVGKSTALNVFFTLDEFCEENPFILSEYNKIIPIPSISPGGKVTMVAAIHDQSPRGFKMNVRWNNPDGTMSKDDLFVSR